MQPMSYSKLRRLLGAEDGVAIVDLAMAIPVLMLLFMGGIELSRYMMLSEKLSRAASNAADLVTQAERVTEDDINQVFAASEIMMEPFAMGTDGTIIITSVITDDVGNATVVWQRKGAGTATKTSAIGLPGSIANLPSGFTMRPSQNVIVAESFYNYTPFLFDKVTSPRELYHDAILRPRFGGLLAVEP